MSNVTSLDEWRKLKKQAEKEATDTLKELLEDWDEIEGWPKLEDVGTPASDTDVSVHHTLCFVDRTDKEFLGIRNLLDEIGASYTVSSFVPLDYPKPPEV